MALPAYAARAGAFDPRNFAGLQAWYDAADSASITLDGGRVSQWSDKSGNARHATNTTSGSTQPSYTTAGRNGLNVISFAAASSQRLSVPSSTATFKFLHDGTPCWWIIVSSYGASANPSAFYFVFATQSGANSVGVNYQFNDLPADGQNNGADFQVSNGTTYPVAGYNAGFPESLKNIITPQSAAVQEMLLDAGNATASSRAVLKVNGGQEIRFNTFTSSPSNANAGLNLTVGSSPVGAYPMQGEMYEMLFFNQQPSATARDLIRLYLARKWGVTLA